MTDKIFLYDKRVKQKKAFTPIDQNNIGMYVCGPTVYDFAHIGNARPVVVFDLLFRLLRLEYGADHVTYVRNITDVDDKIIERSQRDNISVRDLTLKTTQYFHEDTDALGVLRPTHEPRATDHIGDMVDMIQTLLDKNHAYIAEGHVLFDTQSFDNYGNLAGRNLEDMIMGARVEIAPYKKNPTDFVLWKPAAADQTGWDSPFGFGRPGWHIECSAMSKAFLGDHFDIHGGGIDLLFPHHENEVAQSCCANGTDYANYWLHNGFLQINGQKMAKSLGNFLTIRQLREQKNISGAVIRFLLLRTHYRQPLDWTEAGVSEAENILKKWFRICADHWDVTPKLADCVQAALYDDLNMPAAIAKMHGLDALDLAACLLFLGLIPSPDKADLSITPQEIEDYIQKRNIARDNKDFAASDVIRNHLLSLGIILKDSRDGTKWEAS